MLTQPLHWLYYNVLISTIFKHIRSFFQEPPYATSLWSLILILVVLIAGQFVSFSGENVIQSGEAGNYGFGGPVESSEENTGFFLGQSLITAEPTEGGDASLIFDGALILGISHPLTSLLGERGGLLKYKVQEGDTLSGVAARFGITLSTVRWANPNSRSLIRPSEELTILPVSGILYPVKEGDSLEGIASRYHIDPETVKSYNASYQRILDAPGELLVLPYAKPLGSASLASAQNLPNLASYFVLPARGWNWGRLHDSNAVDIADQCGKPVYASAQGLVIEESSQGYWNQGHGNYVILEHPNGTRTRYSHTAKNLVKVGDYVSQGDHIALIGATGNTHGPTGCHLHFEVHGARNPFAVR